MAVKIQWNDPNSGASQEQGVRIYRSLSSIDTNSLPTPLTTVGADVLEYIDDTVNGATTYYYLLESFNSAGSAFSSEANITTASTSLPLPSSTVHVLDWDSGVALIDDGLTATGDNLVWTDTVYGGSATGSDCYIGAENDIIFDERLELRDELIWTSGARIAFSFKLHTNVGVLLTNGGTSLNGRYDMNDTSTDVFRGSNHKFYIDGNEIVEDGVYTRQDFYNDLLASGYIIITEEVASTFYKRMFDYGLQKIGVFSIVVYTNPADDTAARDYVLSRRAAALSA